MKENNLFWIAGDFYRAKQTSAASMILAEKNIDLLSTIIHFCKENNIPITEGMNRLMGEIQILLQRIRDINSLPIQEVLRMPPVDLSPEMKRSNESPEDATQPKKDLLMLKPKIFFPAQRVFLR